MRPALAAWLLVGLVGALGLRTWGQALLPDREPRALVVQAAAPGRSQSDVLARMTAVLEPRLRALPGVAAVVSRTVDGGARLDLPLARDADPERLRLAVQGVLDESGDLAAAGLILSAGVAVAGEASPALELAVLDAEDAAGGAEGGAVAAGERATLVHEVLLPELAALPGAGRVEVVGLALPQAVVTPLAAALAAHGLSAADLAARLRGVGAAVQAGQARAGALAQPLVVRETVATLDQLAALRLPAPGGAAVALGDVARVDVRPVGDGTWFRADGREGTLLRLFPAPGADRAALSRAAHRRIAAAVARMPPALRLRWLADDWPATRDGLAQRAWLIAAGLLCALALLRPTLGSWRRATVLVAAALLLVLATSALLLPLGAWLPAAVPPDLPALVALAAVVGALALDLLAAGSPETVAPAAPVVRVDPATPVDPARSADPARSPWPPGWRQLPHAASDPLIGNLAAIFVLVATLAASGLRPWLGAAAMALAAGLVAVTALALTAAPAFAARPAPVRQDAGPPGAAAAAPGAAVGGGLRALDRWLRRPGLALAGAVVVVGIAVVAVAILARSARTHAAPRAGATVLDLACELAPNLTPEAAAAAGRSLDDAVRAAVSGLGGAVISRSTGAGELGLRLDAAAPRAALGVRVELPGAAAAHQAGERLRRLLAGRFELSRWHLAPPHSAAEPAGEPFPAYVVGASPAARDRLLREVAPLCDAGPVGDPLPPPELQLSWRPETAGGMALDPQIAAALGGIDLGTLEIPGLAPAIRLAPETPPNLAALPLRLGTPGAGDDGWPVALSGAAGTGSPAPLSDGPAALPESSLAPAVVTGAAGAAALGAAPPTGASAPLAALATLTPRPAALPVWRWNGQTALPLRCPAPAAAALHRLPARDAAASGRAARLQVLGAAPEMAAAAERFWPALGGSLLVVLVGCAVLCDSLAVALATLAAVGAALACALAAATAMPGSAAALPCRLGLVVVGAFALRPALLLTRRAERRWRRGGDRATAIGGAAAELFRPLLAACLLALPALVALLVPGDALGGFCRPFAAVVLGGGVGALLGSLALAPAVWSLWRARPPAP